MDIYGYNIVRTVLTLRFVFEDLQLTTGPHKQGFHMVPNKSAMVLKQDFLKSI